MAETPLAQTPNKYEMQTPASRIDPAQFFNVWNTQISMPHMVMKKVSQYVGEYFRIRPELDKKQQENRILFKYNERLVRTVEEFIQHEKKIVEKYNALTKLYIDSFQKYCTTKNLDLNFNIKPLKCLFEKEKISQWKFQPDENQMPSIDKTYQEMLLRVISKYFLSARSRLQHNLNQVIDRRELGNTTHEQEQIRQLRHEIWELNETKITAENMFELLQNMKCIEQEIHQLEPEAENYYQKQGIKFMKQVEALHLKLFKIQPEKIKEYIQEEMRVRRQMRKSHKKLKDHFESLLEQTKNQNLELREELDHQRIKREQIEKERLQLRSKYEYMMLKGTNTSRRERERTMMLTNIDNGSQEQILRETSRSATTKIPDLEAQIRQLKMSIQSLETQKNKLSEENSKMKEEEAEVRMRLLSGLADIGLPGSDSFNLADMIDKIMEQVAKRNTSFDAKNIAEDDSSMKPVNIVITESVRIKDKISYDLQQISHHEQHSENVQESQKEQENSVSQLESKRTKIKKELGDSKQVNLAKTNIYSTQTPVKQIAQPFVTLRMVKGGFSSADLLQISQKNALEQQSKHHDSSRQLRDPSAGSEQKSSERNSPFFKEEQSHMNKILVNRLKDQNSQLKEIIKGLQNQIISQQARMAEKQKTQMKSFVESLEEDIRNADSKHYQQIQNVCQSIAKQLFRLDGNQFEQMVTSMEDAIKTCKIGQTTVKRDQNIRNIPVLSKQSPDDNLFKSQCSPDKEVKEEQQKNKLKDSIATEKGERSMRLTLNSGKIRLQIVQEKSIYFQNKEQANSEINKIPQMNLPLISVAAQTVEFKEDKKGKSDSISQFDEDKFIKNVQVFERRSNKMPNSKIAMNNSDYSLKFSKSINKEDFMFREEGNDLRSIFKISAGKFLESDYISALESKLQQIKENGEVGEELYWFYKKYKQAMEALDRSQKLRMKFQHQKELCMNELTTEETLTRSKLIEKVFILQQELESVKANAQNQKEEYETAITQQIVQMEDIKSKALEALASNFFLYNQP